VRDFQFPIADCQLPIDGKHLPTRSAMLFASARPKGLRAPARHAVGFTVLSHPALSRFSTNQTLSKFVTLSVTQGLFFGREEKQVLRFIRMTTQSMTYGQYQ
jgi:hypothetical protein